MRLPTLATRATRSQPNSEAAATPGYIEVSEDAASGGEVADLVTAEAGDVERAEWWKVRGSVW